MMTIFCTRCKQSKAPDDFTGRNLTQDKSRGQCRSCVSAYRKAYHSERREKHNARSKKAYKALSTQEKRIRSIKSAEYLRTHKKQRLATQKKYRDNNKKELLERGKIYREKNKEKRAITCKRWRDENPVKTRMHCVNRRAKLAGSRPSWFERDDVEKVYARAKWIRDQGLAVDVDHIIPLKGNGVRGLHCLDNLQIIESSKNGAKGNKY